MPASWGTGYLHICPLLLANIPWQPLSKDPKSYSGESWPLGQAGAVFHLPLCSDPEQAQRMGHVLLYQEGD